MSTYVKIMEKMMENKKISKRKVKAMETKRKIYDSANYLIRNNDIDDVSVDAIVNRAGVSKGSFYVHFESKDALIATLIAEYVDKLDLNYESYLQSFPADTLASDMLILLAGKIVDIMTINVGYELINALYKAQITKTTNTSAMLGYNRNLYKIFNNIIGQGQQKEEFKPDININTITNHCIMAIRGITYEWCIRYPDFNLKDAVLEHINILLTGIKK